MEVLETIFQTMQTGPKICKYAYFHRHRNKATDGVHQMSYCALGKQTKSISLKNFSINHIVLNIKIM